MFLQFEKKCHILNQRDIFFNHPQKKAFSYSLPHFSGMIFAKHKYY